MAIRQVNMQGNLTFLLVVLAGFAFLFITAWYAAKKLLGPRDVFSLHDKQISRLEFFRSFGGLVTIVATTLRFRGPRRVIADLLLHLFEALVLGIVALFICIVVAVAISRSRGVLIVRVWRPILKIVLTFGSLFGADAVGHVLAADHLFNIKHPTLTITFGVDAVVLLALFWVIIFELWAFCYSAALFLLRRRNAPTAGASCRGSCRHNDSCPRYRTSQGVVWRSRKSY
jgi:hypothetical protein